MTFFLVTKISLEEVVYHYSGAGLSYLIMLKKKDTLKKINKNIEKKNYNM